jgi:hypothetical protein
VSQSRTFIAYFSMLICSDILWLGSIFCPKPTWARCSASLGNSGNSSQPSVLAGIYLWLEEIPYTPSIALAERILAFFYRCKLFVDGSDLDIAYQCLVEG